jgi:hypothetical protein
MAPAHCGGMRKAFGFFQFDFVLSCGDWKFHELSLENGDCVKYLSGNGAVSLSVRKRIHGKNNFEF